MSRYLTQWVPKCSTGCGLFLRFRPLYVCGIVRSRLKLIVLSCRMYLGIPFLLLVVRCSTRRHLFQHSFSDIFRSIISVFVIWSSMKLVSSSPAMVRGQIAPLAPEATESASRADEQVLKRQGSSPITICGYVNGDPQISRTADPGYTCRIDTANGLWGFCPTSVISARDCGLAGMCVDAHSCTSGCGRLSDRSDITTFSWLVTP
jgi:hypothetical protein